MGLSMTKTMTYITVAMKDARLVTHLIKWIAQVAIRKERNL